VPRLVGALVFFAALLMFLQSAALMFDSWDAVKHFPACRDNASSEISQTAVEDTQLLQVQLAQAKFRECKDSLYDITGVRLTPSQGEISTRQLWEVMLYPTARVLFWLAVLLIGMMIYHMGLCCMPMEHFREMKEKAKRR